MAYWIGYLFPLEIGIVAYFLLRKTKAKPVGFIVLCIGIALQRLAFLGRYAG